MRALEQQHEVVFQQKKKAIQQLVNTMDHGGAATAATQQVQHHDAQLDSLRSDAKALIGKVGAEQKDDDYIFITWVINYLPIGLVGLLLAVIFSAAMSSTAAELNALASTSTVDIYKRNMSKSGSERHYLMASKGFTLLFGGLAISFAILASYFENLIEAVNILGSLFYGTILGIFLVAFFLKWVRGHAVFLAALLAESLVIVVYLLDSYEIISVAYLWLNVIGCLLVMALSVGIQPFIFSKKQTR
jgi:Na+/proline symporter